jgi:hypothetical protein
MTMMRDRTFFDVESGSIIDLPPQMWTKRGDPVKVKPGPADLQPGETKIVVETLGGERREIVFPVTDHVRVADTDVKVKSLSLDKKPPVIVTTGDGRKVEIDHEGGWLEVEPAAHRYDKKFDRPGEYAAYRERVEAQFSAPIPKNGDMDRAVSVVISGFNGVGKSTIGRIIAQALADHGVTVSLQGLRANTGIAPGEVKWPRDPMSVELWEVDRTSPHNH